jgi:hypothetical protein
LQFWPARHGSRSELSRDPTGSTSGARSRALAIVGGLAIIVVLSPFLGSGAGLGVILIYLAYVALVVAVAVLACLAATARHAWDALRSRR